jgi:two-component system nitrate/nitrite response regulator NarL
VREIRLRRSDDLPVLSARELEVLRLAADGLSAVEIGRRLHLSRTTVRTHLQHIYEKLGVGDRTAAVAQALRSGLLH